MKQSNNKMLILLIVVLVITNLAMLWYFTRETKAEQKPMSRTERMADWMKKELKLDDAQTQEYIRLRLMRDSLLAPLNTDLRQAKQEFISLLNQPDVADSTVAKAAQKVAEKQMPVELEFFRHFKRVKTICTPAQFPAFDSLLMKTIRRNTGDTTAGGNN